MKAGEEKAKEEAEDAENIRRLGKTQKDFVEMM